MRHARRLAVAVLGCAAGAGGCTEPSYLPGAEAPPSRPAAVAPRLDGSALTRAQLQERLMGFADRYLNRMSEAMDTVAAKHDTPECRVAALATKYYPGLTVVTIAGDSDPEAALLDLVVVVTLERMVWEGEWAREVYGEHAEIVCAAQRDVEADIWRIAATVMTPAQLEELRELIEAWRREHRDRRYVSSTRFDDFAALRARRPSQAFEFDLLLAPVSDAARAVEQARLLGERTLFIASRMPLLLQWQAELLMQEAAAHPEFRELLADSRSIATAASSLAETAARWPEDVARERSALIAEIERHETLVADLVTHVRASLADARGLADEIARITQSAGPVVQDAQSLTRSIQETLLLTDRLTERIERLSSSEQERDARPFDIRDYAEAAQEVTEALQELNRALTSTDELIRSSVGDTLLRRLQTLMDHRLELIAAEARVTVDRLFWTGAALIGIATAAVLLLTIVRRRLIPPRVPRT